MQPPIARGKSRCVEGGRVAALAACVVASRPMAPGGARRATTFRSKILFSESETRGQRVREHGVLAVARDAAGVAVAPLAVVRVHLLQRLLPLDDEERLADGRVDDVPRERFLEVLVAEVPALRDARGLERLRPALPREVLAPRVEAPAPLPHLEDGASHAAVAEGEHRLDLRLLRLVPRHLRALDGAEAVLEVRDLSLQILDAVEPEPLERREALRDEAAHGDVHFGRTPCFRPCARMSLTSVTSSSRSGSVSVGRPIIV